MRPRRGARLGGYGQLMQRIGIVPELRPLLLAAAALVAVGLLDPWSIPAGLLMLVLGFFVGASLPAVTFPAEGPVTGLRRRQPWTEPGFNATSFTPGAW